MDYEKITAELENLQATEHGLVELTRAMTGSLQKMNERISRLNERLTLLETRLDELNEEE